VNRPDRVLGPLTARQAVLLAAVVAGLYGAWLAVRAVVALPVFLAIALPIGALGAAIALGQRDGLPLDRYLLAALRHQLNPHRPTPPAVTAQLLPAPPAGARLESGVAHVQRVPGERTAQTPLPDDPAITSLSAEMSSPGLLDLGNDGVAAVAVVSTLDLRLGTPAEQEGLVVGFARYLHTLTGPAQFLIRTVPVDLTGHLTALTEQARTLPHPALVAAALGHRTYLAYLAAGEENALLSRQVLLVLREPTGRGATQRLWQRLDDATTLLAALDITATPLPAGQLRALLADYTHPDHRRFDPAAGAHPAPVPVALVRSHPTADRPQRAWSPITSSPIADPWGELPRVPGPAREAAAQRGGADFGLVDDQYDELNDGENYGYADGDGDLEGGGLEGGGQVDDEVVWLDSGAGRWRAR
jgi:hypothetical protein